MYNEVYTAETDGQLANNYCNYKSYPCLNPFGAGKQVKATPTVWRTTILGYQNIWLWGFDDQMPGSDKSCRRFELFTFLTNHYSASAVSILLPLSGGNLIYRHVGASVVQFSKRNYVKAKMHRICFHPRHSPVILILLPCWTCCQVTHSNRFFFFFFTQRKICFLLLNYIKTWHLQAVIIIWWP